MAAIHPYDLRVIGHYLGTLLLFFAALMALPLATALVFQEWEPAARYLAAIGITHGRGLQSAFSAHRTGRLDRRQAPAVTGFAWVVLALFASFPLYFSGHYMTYLDAVRWRLRPDHHGRLAHRRFGSPLLRRQHCSASLCMPWAVSALSWWRCPSGFSAAGGGASLFSSEGRSEHVVPNVVQTTPVHCSYYPGHRFCRHGDHHGVMPVHGHGAHCAFLNALWVSTSGFVTGGFTPMQLSIMYIPFLPLEAILMVLMILGSISFVIHAEVWKGRPLPFFRDIETKTMVLGIGSWPSSSRPPLPCRPSMTCSPSCAAACS